MSSALFDRLRAVADLQASLEADPSPAMLPTLQARWRRAYFEAFRMTGPGTDYDYDGIAARRYDDRLEVEIYSESWE